MDILILGILGSLAIGFLPFWVSLGAGKGGVAWKAATFILCLVNPFGFAAWPLFLSWFVAWVTAFAAYSAARRERTQQAMLDLMIRDAAARDKNREAS